MDQLRRLRTERKLSQAKLAARAGLDPSTVNQIERGAREASPATLRKLAEALGVSVAELLDPKASAPPSPLEPSFNDVLKAEEERRSLIPLIALFDTHTREMTEASKGHRKRIAGIRENLSYEQAIAIYQWVFEFVYYYRLKNWALASESFTAAVYPWYERLAAGPSAVPEDVRRAMLDFANAWNELSMEVVPMAIEWAEREKERHRADAEVARLSAEFDRMLKERDEAERSPIRELLLSRG